MGGRSGRTRALGLCCQPLELLVQIDTMGEEPRSTTADWNLLLNFFTRMEAHQSFFVGTVARLGGDKLCMDGVQTPSQQSPCCVGRDVNGGANLIVMGRSLIDPNNVASPA